MWILGLKGLIQTPHYFREFALPPGRESPNMTLNLFNTVNIKEQGHGQRSVVWLKCDQPCSHHLHVLSTTFSWRPLSTFSLWIIPLPPSPPPLIFSLINQCDRCLVLLAWGLMVGGCWFASHGGITLSRGWLWKPLDIPGTHLH